MKTKILPFILAVLSVGIVLDSVAGNPVLSGVEKEKTSTRQVNSSDIRYREFDSFRFSSYDPFENNFVLEVSGTFGKLTEENSYTDNVRYHTPSGGVYYDEFVAHQLDKLGRESIITWTNNEGGSPNYSVKKRLSLNYHDDTWRLTGKYTEILGFAELGLVSSEELILDNMGNATSLSIKNYDPSSGIVISFTSDSIRIKYDVAGNITEEINYSYDAFQELMIPIEQRLYEWEGDVITSSTVNHLNPDGSYKAPNYRIDNISTTLVPNPFEKLHEISFGTEPWADAASHRRSDYVNEEWKTKYVQDKISFGKFTVTTSRLEDDELVPWKRTTESNQQQSLYNKMKYILPLAQPETYFKDLTEETYFPDNNEWVPFFETRNTISLSINFGLEAKTKSAAEGDSVLTLIYQTYDPGSGEWINNYKQEFTFRNLATSAREKVENNNNITIYPNPNSGVLNVSLKNVNGLSQISIVNAVGQTVLTKRFDDFSGNSVFTEDLSYLKKGIYFVQVFSEGGMLSKKLILQ